MSQTVYSDELDTGIPGLVSESNNRETSIGTYFSASNGALIAGTACKNGTGSTAIPLDAGSDLILGIVMRDPTVEDSTGLIDVDAGSMAYPDEWAVPILAQGNIWVAAEEPITPLDQVWVRFDSNPEIFTVTFDIDFVASNVINGLVGEETIAPVTFSVDHTTTLTALAAAIQALTGVATATVTGAREITVTGAGILDLSPTTNFTVTLGVSQPADTVANVTGPSAGDVPGVFRTDDGDSGSGAEAIRLLNCRYVNDSRSVSSGVSVLLDANIP